MESSAASQPTILMRAEIPGRSVVTNIVLALAGSLLLALSAKIQVPFWPVPMTMQTMVVLLIGMAYGTRIGGATMLLYLAEGAMGIPVFAGPGAGPTYFLGPTGGYLVGFAAAAGLAGWLAERRPLGVRGVAVVMAVGHALIFAFGLAWLSALVGFEKAIAVGLTPFVAATVVKIALGTALLQAAWWGLTQRR